ncbi:MAG: threonine/serine dehydratase [Woeseia sp.]|nr:threonine/serine dehydratase [Woeseia sp.]
MVETPVIHCRNLERQLGNDIEIWGKLEFLQKTGTFKTRGALATVLGLTDGELAAGITAVSAGNHAIAAAFAAKAIGTTAKVVMMRSANPARVAACKAYGAEVIMSDDAHSAFALAEKIQRDEGRFFVHPFEGETVVSGTATVGLEICEQIGAFDALICPIGGGGLCAGVSSAVKQLNPDCEVFGVEPTGADSMRLSFLQGKATRVEEVNTIADSLGAPFALPYSFSVCHQNVDELVMVDDDALRDSMGLLFREMKLAVEPACAATTAAISGPLKERLSGKKVVLVFCGSNIDAQTYLRLAYLT